MEKQKTLAERNCHMVFEPNTVMNCVNGYLVKSDGTLGYIKAFLYNTNEESEAAATIWANNHPRQLKNAGWGESFQLQKCSGCGFNMGRNYENCGASADGVCPECGKEVRDA